MNCPLVRIGVIALALCGNCLAMEAIRISEDQKTFKFSDSGKPFIPWGFNYGHTDALIEDFWQSNWQSIERDFAYMHSLGANVVRVHLQVGKFMDGPNKPNAQALKKLGELLKLAEEKDLYLDITGLGCYRPADVPAWYDALSETDRWATQARFWEAVAGRCADSPAVFCYDLMNEPFVPGGRRDPGKWRSGVLLGGFDFVQFISLDQANRPREQIALLWITTLTAAIRKADRNHLITVGMLPWDKKWGFLSGFAPEKVSPDVDFIAVHIYPEAGKPDEAIDMLKKFAIGKPVVIEETFPLSCSCDDLKQFLLASRGIACGWIWHYSGQTIEELEEKKKAPNFTIAQAIWLSALELFRDLGPRMMEFKAQ